MNKKLTIFTLILTLFTLGAFAMEVSAAAKVLAPVDVNVTTNAQGDPEITWKKVSGAAGYRVYRKTSADRSWVKLETVKNAKYIDNKWSADSASVIQYTVSAYKKKNGSSDWSSKSKSAEWTVPVYSMGLAYEQNQWGTEYWIVGKGTCTDTDLIIPTRYKGLPVRKVLNLSELPEITSVKLSSSITEIGEDAFRLCTGLTEIFIPQNVRLISGNPFWECNHIKSIKVDERNLYYDSRNDCNAIIETSNRYLISGCGTTVIPEDVQVIQDQAFCGQDSLTDITLPSGLKWIGLNAFRDCSSLNNISIPESVSSIGAGAFAGCSTLTNISLPKGITEISEFTFMGCSNLESISIPDSVTLIDEFAFKDCGKLKEITLPSGITQISAYCFFDCESLTEINIPDGVTEIGDYALDTYSTDLKTITIPKSVTSFGESCFYTHQGLKLRVVKGSVADTELKESGYSDYIIYE